MTWLNKLRISINIVLTRSIYHIPINRYKFELSDINWYDTKVEAHVELIVTLDLN